MSELPNESAIGLAFDLGGTSLRVGSVDASGRIIDTIVEPTPSTASGVTSDQLVPQLIDTMVDMGKRVCGKVRIVSLAFPGPVETGGIPLAAPTVWRGLRFGPSLLEGMRLAWGGVPIHIVNDVAAAGYHLVSQGRSDFCLTTVSSGIGAQIFLNGQPVGGAYGGEIGHVRLPDPQFALAACECGGTAHLGAVSSGRGTLEVARTWAVQHPDSFSASWLYRQGVTADTLTTYDLVAAFHAADPWTHHLITESSRPLGRTLAITHAAVGITDFPIMGGFAVALGGAYLNILAQHAADHVNWLDQEWRAMLSSVDVLEPGLAGSAWLIARILAKQTSEDRHG